MPLAMSSANLTAWLWSTTRAEEGREPRRGVKTWRAAGTSVRMVQTNYSLVPWCRMLKRDP